MSGGKGACQVVRVHVRCCMSGGKGACQVVGDECQVVRMNVRW